MHRRPRRAARPRLEILDARWLPAALTPAQVIGAYGLDAVRFPMADGSTVVGDGSGQTIAIVTAYYNPALAESVGVFNQAYGLPGFQLTRIALTDRIDSGWAEEQTLDVQWAHAAAPGANIVVVEAASPGRRDILAAINVARNVPGVSVVSMSFGSDEFANQARQNGVFRTPAGHGGVTFVAAAGDSGAGAEWPAASPYVVAVGGTTLNVGVGGVAESSWSSGGGGASLYEFQPSYQRGVQSSGRRTTPDVAMLANPATGASVYFIDPFTGVGEWEQVGGTSLAAPIFAGMVAIANQGRALRGLGPLDGVSQTLPTLYASAGTGAFNDITSGTRARPGYDTVTGLGSPNAPELVANLVATTGSVPLSTSSAARSGLASLAARRMARARQAALRPRAEPASAEPALAEAPRMAVNVPAATMARPARAVLVPTTAGATASPFARWNRRALPSNLARVPSLLGRAGSWA